MFGKRSVKTTVKAPGKRGKAFASALKQPSEKPANKGKFFAHAPSKSSIAIEFENAQATEQLFLQTELTNDELESRETAYAELVTEVAADTTLPLAYRMGPDCQLVMRKGPLNARLMIIGEAPGAKEAELGQPFVGPSGTLLAKMLLAQSINADKHVFTTNVVFVQPPGNRDPFWEEIVAYLPYLRRLIAIVRPKQILCLGRISSALLSRGFDSIGSMKGIMRSDGMHAFQGTNFEQMYKNIANASALVLKPERLVARVYSAYHPAFLLRQEEKLPAENRYRERWDADFAEVRRLMDEAAFQFIDAEEIVAQTEPPGFVYTRPTDSQYCDPARLSPDAASQYAADGLEMEMHRVEYDERKNVYNMFGRTADDHSVCLCVQNPQFSFLVSHPYLKYNRMTPAQLNRLQEHLYNHLMVNASPFVRPDTATDTAVNLSLVQREKYIDISRSKTMLLVEYRNHKYKRELVGLVDRYFAENFPDWRPAKTHRSLRPPGLNAVKTYEANRTPVQQLLTALTIYVRGWVVAPSQYHSSLTFRPHAEQRISTAELEYSVEFSQLRGYSPNPDEAGNAKWERQAPTRVLSLDAEMLNTAGMFPRSEQDPVISICAYANTFDRADKQNYTERIRSAAAGKDRETRPTGRSNYDDAVVFCVGSLADIKSSQFKPTHLPNVPLPPKSFSSGWNLGGRDAENGAYAKQYGVDIRVWNDFIETFQSWRAMVGERRARWIVKDAALFDILGTLESRPGGKDIKKEWPDEAKILQWERRVQYVMQRWAAGVKHKDIANLPTPQSWETDLDMLSQEDAERELGTVQARWHMFRPALRVHTFRTESDMFRGFYTYIRSYDPDIITGYNSNNFDLTYFIKRVQVLNLLNEVGNEFISMGRYRSKPDTDVLKQSFSKATGERTYHTPQVPGRDCYDLMNYVMRDCKLASYGLASVSEAFLKDTKNDVPYSAIPSLFRNNRERLNAYCAKDAELVLMLMNDMNNMNYLISLARLLGMMHTERLYVDGKQEQVFSVLLRFLREQGLGKVMPDRNIYSHENPEEAEAFEGAHVFDPKTKGLYEKLLLCLDYNALYPTIMLALNLGHDKAGTAARMAKYNIPLDRCFKTVRTFVNPKTGMPEHWYFVQPRKLSREEAIAAGFAPDADCNVVPEIPGFHIFERTPGGERYRVYEKELAKTGLSADAAVLHIPPVPAVYSPKIDDAAICAVLKKILAARKRVNIKKELFHPSTDDYRRLNMIQMALKIVANSTYGATGVKTGKLAGQHISASVTAMGKETILKLASEMERVYGADVQGGDTDSIFVHFPHIDTLDKIFEPIKATNPRTGEVYETTRIKEILTFANSLVPQPMKIDFEKAFEAMFALAKKRAATLTQTPVWDPSLLAMVFKEAKLEYKGLEMKRRDSCKAAQTILTGFVERIFLGAGNKEERELNAVQYATERINNIMQGDVRFHEMIQSRQLSKKTYKTQVPHMILAEKMRKRGYRPRELGERVNFIVVTGRKTRTFSESVEDPDYALEHDLMPDYNYIVQKKIQTPVERFTAHMANGPAYNKTMFGSNVKRHRENLLDDDPLFKHVRACVPCMVCSKPSLTPVCAPCKPNADWRALLAGKQAVLETAQAGYEKAMKTCRRCTGVGPDEGIDCDNGNCSEYFPRRRGEYDIAKHTAELRDIEALI